MKQEKNDQDKAAKSSMKKLVSEINSHYKSVAPLILKGCSISCESFEKIRQIMYFDLKQDFAVVPRCQLPKIALGSLNAMYVKEKEEILCIFSFVRCTIINPILSSEVDVCKVIWKNIYAKVSFSLTFLSSY